MENVLYYDLTQVTFFQLFSAATPRGCPPWADITRWKKITCVSLNYVNSAILLIAKATLTGSSMVMTGTLLGICKVELILTNISSLSANGGVPIVTLSE